MKNKIIISLTIIIIIAFLLTIIFWGIKKNNKTIRISNNEIQLEMMKYENEKDFDESNYSNEKDFDESNYSEVNKKLEEKVQAKLLQEKVLNKESEKRKITITNEQEDVLKKAVFKNEISEESKSKIAQMNMNEDEFKEYVYNKMIQMQKRVELKRKLLEEITSNAITIDNEDFKNEVDEFNNSKNIEENADEVILRTEELLNKYIHLLESNYTVIVD